MFVVAVLTTLPSKLRGFLLSSPLAMNFSGRSPEEFRPKIFADEDFQPPCCACCSVSFAWEIARDSLIVNMDDE